MKRFQLFLVGAFVAAGPLFAQSADADWHSEVAKVIDSDQPGAGFRRSRTVAEREK
jgi:hypothetical protein